MPQPIDLAGRRVGRLTVQTFVGRRRVGTQIKRFWRCLCDCGALTTLPTGALTQASTLSCGCLLREAITTHGGHDDPVYKVWHAMLERCRNPRNAAFPDYGARGIVVCPRWRDFAVFRADMGPRPLNGMLERIDVNGMYEPEN